MLRFYEKNSFDYCLDFAGEIIFSFVKKSFTPNSSDIFRNKFLNLLVRISFRFNPIKLLNKFPQKVINRNQNFADRYSPQCRCEMFPLSDAGSAVEGKKLARTIIKGALITGEFLFPFRLNMISEPPS